MEKLKDLHPVLIALGMLLGAVAAYIPPSSPWHLRLLGAAGTIGSIGGWLARAWQPLEVKAALAASEPKSEAQS